MDTMHDDIASLGHKHDYTMTKISELQGNVNDLRNNVEHVNDNVNSMKDLLFKLTDKIQDLATKSKNTVEPTAIPSTAPPIVPTDVPSTLPTDPTQPISFTLRPSQIPSCMLTHNLHTLSQASSFTSIPQQCTRNVT
eukprot:15360495-Ditylum_brightwellii.AAC.1